MTSHILNLFIELFAREQQPKDTRPMRSPITPTNAAEFLQLKFISSVLSFEGGCFVRTEYRKDPMSGLMWKWSFPIHSIKTAEG